MVHIQECVLSHEITNFTSRCTWGGVSIAVQSNLLSTLKGTANLYFLSKVHVSTGRHSVHELGTE